MILNWAQELGSLNCDFVIILDCHILSDWSTDMTNSTLNKAALGGPRRYCLSTAQTSLGFLMCLNFLLLKRLGGLIHTSHTAVVSAIPVMCGKIRIPLWWIFMPDE